MGRIVAAGSWNRLNSLVGESLSSVDSVYECRVRAKLRSVWGDTYMNSFAAALFRAAVDCVHRGHTPTVTDLRFWVRQFVCIITILLGSFVVFSPLSMLSDCFFVLAIHLVSCWFELFLSVCISDVVNCSFHLFVLLFISFYRRPVISFFGSQ